MAQLSVPESPLTLLVRYEGARGPTGGVDLELVRRRMGGVVSVPCAQAHTSHPTRLAHGQSSQAAGLSLGPRRRTVTAGTYVATLPA